jgi:CRISPR-associated endonuclease/helicase Cas3
MTFDQFFQRATGTAPYAYQRTFAEASTLPDLLEAPTGSGKTATAVLGWLWRRRHGTAAQRQEAGRRLIFCLPMRTLVTQTHENVRRWREKLALTKQDLGVHVLLGGAVDDAWEEQPDHDAILIGTQDQLLSRALLRGYGMNRFFWPVHFALLNNDCTWVLDEVQLMGVGASTAAQLQAFREKIGTVGSARTVWMTATLDEGRLNTVDATRARTRLPFDAVNDASLLLRTQAKKKLEKASAPEMKALADEIALQHVPGTLTLVVVNRVARAQELFALLEKKKGDESRALIHSRFRPSDRGPQQAEALSKDFAGIVVATQAIEAGVDISARTLFTELAPWSSLVQRFGRLNRAGEWKNDEARAFWIDLDTSDEKKAKDTVRPYEVSDLEKARSRLKTLTDVGPASLAKIPRDSEQPALPVVRRKDLLDLFDTEPDLAGHDIDVSRYVRATDERDVQVAWRALEERAPAEDAPALRADELCRVPFFELEKLLGKDKRAWRFDSLRRSWVEVDHLFPGLVLVVDVSVGGYSDTLGFTKDKRDVPTSREHAGDPEQSDDDDPLALGADDYVSLTLHSQDAAQEMEALVDRLAVEVGAVAEARELVAAARFHDLGKVHEVFQQMLTQNLHGDDPRRLGGPWAKSDGKGGGRSSRKFFRHELASALAWLHEGRSDLGAFIIAAHHGKVRLSLRARPTEKAAPEQRRFCNGVWDGDVLPATDLGDGVKTGEQKLSLALMELGGGGEGPSWADRMLRLLDELGPFRLAWLETLVRVADWRASARRSTKLGGRNG